MGLPFLKKKVLETSGRCRPDNYEKEVAMKTPWVLIEDSYAAPDGSTTSGVFTSVTLV